MMDDDIEELKQLVKRMEALDADREAEYRNGVRDDDCDRAAQAVLECAKRIATWQTFDAYEQIPRRESDVVACVLCNHQHFFLSDDVSVPWGRCRRCACETPDYGVGDAR